jgi:2-keto-3-deoxy-L-rhamnonate aldolase RhmA
VIKQTEIGTFVKTASPQVVEVLGTTDLGFVVVDAEHAPFDRGMLDLMVMAGRASQIPVFIRIAEINASVILRVLTLVRRVY